MKKITIGAFLFILLITVQVMYINYRLEQKLDNIQLNQQNILTQVYSLERSTQQTTTFYYEFAVSATLPPTSPMR